MMRWSITGITTSESHFSSSIACRQPSGSNLRRRTMVEPSSMPSARWAKPHVWNSGAAMWVRQPYRNGSRDRIDTAASMPASFRGAPLGVPVVPEVRITIRVWWSGGLRSSVGYDEISDSTVSSWPSESAHATSRLSTDASARRSVNSSSWITMVGSSRSRTSTSCGPAKAVLR